MKFFSGKIVFKIKNLNAPLLPEIVHISTGGIRFDRERQAQLRGLRESAILNRHK